MTLQIVRHAVVLSCLLVLINAVPTDIQTEEHTPADEPIKQSSIDGDAESSEIPAEDQNWDRLANNGEKKDETSDLLSDDYFYDFDYSDYDINDPLGFLSGSPNEENENSGSKTKRATVNDRDLERMGLKRSGMNYIPNQQQPIRVSSTMKRIVGNNIKVIGGGYSPEQQARRKASFTFNHAKHPGGLATGAIRGILTGTYPFGTRYVTGYGHTTGGYSGHGLTTGGYGLTGGFSGYGGKLTGLYGNRYTGMSKVMPGQITVTRSHPNVDMSKALFMIKFLTSMKNKLGAAGHTNVGGINGGGFMVGGGGNTQRLKSYNDMIATLGGKVQTGGASINLLSRNPSELLKPFIRFIAIQNQSPVNHWGKFMKQVGSENSSGAYKTLVSQINFENRQQQALLLKLKNLQQIVSQKPRCLVN